MQDNSGSSASKKDSHSEVKRLKAENDRKLIFLFLWNVQLITIFCLMQT
jgi:hypothetical protein